MQLILVFGRHHRYMSDRERTRRVPLAAWPALLGILVLSACNGFVGEWIVLDGFGRRFTRVQKGHARPDVVAELGAPARELPMLQLPQRAGYEAMYEEAQRSSASTYLYWDTGLDEVAVVGLNGRGTVVFKCRAGT